MSKPSKEKTTFQVRDLRKRLNRALKKKSELNNRIMIAIKYLEEKGKDDDNWIGYELCIEPVVIKNILQGGDKE